MFHCEMFSGEGSHVGVATKVLICTGGGGGPVQIAHRATLLTIEQ